MVAACKHCKKRHPNKWRRRGLCVTCHGDLAIRQLYPSPFLCGHRGVTPKSNRGRKPQRITNEPAGSEAKILVMIERVGKGENACHPLDSLEKIDTANSIRLKHNGVKMQSGYAPIVYRTDGRTHEADGDLIRWLLHSAPLGTQSNNDFLFI